MFDAATGARCKRVTLLPKHAGPAVYRVTAGPRDSRGPGPAGRSETAEVASRRRSESTEIRLLSWIWRGEVGGFSLNFRLAGRCGATATAWRAAALLAQPTRRIATHRIGPASGARAAKATRAARAEEYSQGFIPAPDCFSFPMTS
jgi:hypothetical protein